MNEEHEHWERELTDDDLRQELESSLNHLSRVRGQTVNPVTDAVESKPGDSDAVAAVIARHNLLSGEVSRRNSARCSREVTRFKQILDSGEPWPEDVAIWWRNRY